jgi:hypothetical protein
MNNRRQRALDAKARAEQPCDRTCDGCLVCLDAKIIVPALAADNLALIEELQRSKYHPIGAWGSDGWLCVDPNCSACAVLAAEAREGEV